MKIKLAEALLRRRELQEKVDQLRPLRVSDLFETKVKRMKVTDNIDDVTAQVAKVDAAQITAEFDHYAKQLREVDAFIQQANWTTDIEVNKDNMKNWEIA